MGLTDKQTEGLTDGYKQTKRDWGGGGGGGVGDFPTKVNSERVRGETGVTHLFLGSLRLT